MMQHILSTPERGFADVLADCELADYVHLERDAPPPNWAECLDVWGCYVGELAELAARMATTIVAAPAFDAARWQEVVDRPLGMGGAPGQSREPRLLLNAPWQKQLQLVRMARAATDPGTAYKLMYDEVHALPVTFGALVLELNRYLREALERLQVAPLGAAQGRLGGS